MNRGTIKELCEQELINSREKHFLRLEKLYDGAGQDKVFVLSGVGGKPPHADPYVEPEIWVDMKLDSLAEQKDFLLDQEVFRPLIMECWLYGVHFTDKVFGANVYQKYGQWWSEGLSNKIGELPEPDLEKNETWLKAKALTMAMINAGATVPLITTQVLDSPLNHTFNIYKNELLVSFYENPKGVKRDLEIVTDILCEMHKWFLGIIPEQQFQPVAASGRCQPRGYGQICGCATQLVSPEIYNEFIAPLDEKVFSLYKNGGMIHLCGAHAQHIKTWREMKRLKAIQVNDRASQDLQLYYEGLRDDQIIYFTTAREEAIERAIEITSGQRLVIGSNLEKAPMCKK